MSSEFHASLKAKGRGAKGWANSWTEIEHLGDGKFAASISVGHRAFKDKEDGKWKKRKLTDERPDKDYILIQSAKCCVEVYPFYAKYFDVHHEEVRLYEERWVVQRLFKEPDEWRNVDAYNPVISVEDLPDALKVTIVYDTDYGSLTIEYFQRDGSALKHNVFFTNNSNQIETFRVVQKWAGIVGTKCNGKDAPIEEDASHFAFHSADKPQREFNIAENLGSMVLNPDESEKTEKCLQRPIKIESHAQGLKADFIYAQWILTQNESLEIDPATVTLNNPTVDGYIRGPSPGYLKYTDNNYIMSGYTSGDYYIWRGFVEWNISSIPDGSTITDTIFKYHGSRLQNPSSHLHEMLGARPSTATNAALWAECNEGTVYYNVAGFPIVGANRQADLGANADSDLQAQLTAGDWFAIGMSRNNEGTPYGWNDIFSEEYPSAIPKPTLYVVYTPPTATPTVTTQAADNIGVGAGTLHGTITDIGGLSVDERGFDYDYDSGAPYAYEETDLGSFGTGAFEEALSGLTQGVTVYFRAKAHNSLGWGYGGELNFRTLQSVTKTALAGFGIVGVPARWSGRFASVTASISQAVTAVRQVAFTRASGVFKFPYTFPFRFGSITTMGMVGAAAGTWGITRFASAAVGLVGAAGRSLVGVRGALAEMSAAAFTQRSFVGARSAAPSISMIAAAVRVLALSRVASAAVSAVGASIRNWVGPRSVAASVAQLATTARAIVVTRAASGAAAIVGTAGRMYGALRTIAAAIDMAGTTIRGWAGTRSTEAVMSVIPPILTGSTLILHMDEGRGDTIYDSSSEGNDGTIYGASWVDGEYGKALSFDDVNDYVHIPDFTIPDDHTIVFTLRLPYVAAGSWRRIFNCIGTGTDRSPGIWAHINYPQRLHWRYNPGNLGFSNIGPGGEGTDFVVDTPYRIIGVKEGTTLKLYVNGSFVASVSVPEVITPGTYLRMGNPSVPRSMIIDEVRVYPYALSEYERGLLWSLGAQRQFVGGRDAPAGFSLSGVTARIYLALRSVSATLGISGITDRAVQLSRLAVASMSAAGAAVRGLVGSRIASAAVSIVGATSRLKHGLRTASALISATGKNLIKDSSYELGIWASGIRTDEDSWHGNYSAKLVAPPGGSSGLSNIIPRTALTGKTFTVSAYVKIPTMAVGNFYLRFHYHDVNNVYVVHRDWKVFTGSVPSWTRYNLEVGPASSFHPDYYEATDHIHVDFCWWRSGGGSDGTAYVDAYQLELGSLTDYKEENALRSWVGTRAISAAVSMVGTADRMRHRFRDAAAALGLAGNSVRAWIGTRASVTSISAVGATARQIVVTRFSGLLKFPYTFPFKFGAVSGIGSVATASASWAVVRIASAAASISGVAARSWIGSRVISAAASVVGITDRIIDTARTAAGGVSIVGLTDRALTGARTAAAGIGQTAVSIRSWIGARAVAASTTISSVTIRSWVGTRFTSAAASIVGTPTRIKGALRSASAAASIVGATARGWAGVRVTSAVMNIVPSTQRSWAGARSAVAAFSMAGATARLYGALRSVAASVGVAGAAVRGWIGIRAAAATASMAAASARMYGALRSASAAVGLVGTSIRGWIGTRFSVATISAVGTTARNWLAIRAASATASIVGTPARIKLALRSAAAAIGLVGATIRIKHGLRMAMASVSQTAAAIRAIAVTRFSGLLKFPYTFPFKFGSTAGIGIVATATRSWMNTRIASAAASITGAASRSVAGIRAVSAAFGMAGATARAWVGGRIASAAISVVGITGRLKYGFRSASATLSQIATTSREAVLTRKAAASTTIEGVAGRMYGALRSAAANAGITGAAVRIKHGLRMAMASASLMGATGRSWIGERVTSAAASIVGMPARVKGGLRTASAAIGIVEVAGRRWVGTRFSGVFKFPYTFPFKFGSKSAIGMAANAGRSWVITRFVSAAVSVVGATGRLKHGLRSASASTSQSAAATRALVLTRVTSAALGVSGVAGRIIGFIRSVAASVGVVGATVRIVGFTRSAVATITAAGSTFRGWVGTRSVSASIGQTAASIREAALTRTVAAATSIVGVTGRIIETIRSAAATITTTAATARSLILTRFTSASKSVVAIAGRIRTRTRIAAASISAVADVWNVGRIVDGIVMLRFAGKTRILDFANKDISLRLSFKLRVLDFADKIRKLRFGRKET